tara:strand:+ start:227 stop:484 length:258 start_codon:yes stop_codon:yes gene_type:complete
MNDESHIFKYKKINIITNKPIQIKTLGRIKIFLNWLNEIEDDLLLSNSDLRIDRNKLYDIKANIITEINIVMLEDNIKFEKIIFT